MNRPAKNDPDEILDAAERVVLRDGAAKLTLDAAAREAGVSKGGLQYLFPSKAKLLEAMVERMSTEMKLKFEGFADPEDSGEGEMARREIRALMDESSAPNAHHAAVLAVIANDLSLLHAEHKNHREILEKMVSDGLPFEKAAIVQLAVAGFWLQRLLTISPYSSDEVERIRGALIDLTRNGSDQ